MAGAALQVTIGAFRYWHFIFELDRRLPMQCLSLHAASHVLDPSGKSLGDPLLELLAIVRNNTFVGKLGSVTSAIDNTSGRDELLS